MQNLEGRRLWWRVHGSTCGQILLEKKNILNIINILFLTTSSFS